MWSAGALPAGACLRFGGRYRLDHRVGASTGWSTWKAFDETLARAVTILVFDRGFPRITDTVAAACAASRIDDARLARVFDVAADWGHTYIVMEWVTGDSLQHLLARGALDPGQGAEIVAQGAAALAAAHACRVAHLCLTPNSLCWTPSGGVKVVGLGIDAALHAVIAADPVSADTHALGRLLYAALTAHWPGRDWPSLPAAPQDRGGQPRSPGLVRAGVPAELGDIACQVLSWRAAPGASPLTTPALLATALNRLIPEPVVPPPVPPVYQAAPARQAMRSRDTQHRHREAGPPRGPKPGQDASSRRGAATWMWAIAGMLVLAATGATAWQLSHSGSGPDAAAASHQPAMARPPSPSARTGNVLPPAGAAAFGPYGGDNPAEAALAIGDRPGTGWTTDSYLGSPHFGNLYGGTGLVIDMGKRVRVSSVTVTFGRVPGAHARVEVGSTGTGPVPAGFTTLARTSNASGTVGFTGRRAAAGRYVLIWFTKLAPEPGPAGWYQAGIVNVVVHGRP
jgi:hypothetical protein